METWERVLEVLYKEKEYISGEEMAKKLGITRNSVWKAINKLKEQGYGIDSIQRRGYLLEKNDGVIDSAKVKSLLQNQHNVYFYKEATSSNDIAKELCKNGENEGSVVVVEAQTKGRGRMGRSFISNSANGLYMSIILRPTIPANKCINITVMCAVAVSQAIEEVCQRDTKIKWVNDIYINEKKVCGILTEAAIDLETGGLQYAVVGIGVNVSQPKGGFAEEIKDIAGAIYESQQPSKLKGELCAKIIDNFFKLYYGVDNKEYLNVYRTKSNIIGKEVDVYIGNETVYGVAINIDENANLIVKDNDGRLHSFNSGEARVRKSLR